MRIINLLTRFIKSRNRAVTILNWINKTPLRLVVKKCLILANYNAWKARQDRSIYSAVTQTELTAIESLAKYGYAYVTSLIDPKVLELLLEKSNSLKADVENISQNQLVRTKEIWVRLTDQEYTRNNTTSNVFNRVALQDSVLRVVGGYFKSAPYFVDSLLTLSTGSDAPLKYSQLWHKDYNDTKMLKLFVYLTDVEEDKYGPFMFIDKIMSTKIRRPFLSSHFSDDYAFSQVSLENVIQVKQKKLSVFMVDTSKCYHAGSRLEPGLERLMLTSMYVDLPCIYPWVTNNSVQDDTFSLSALQRMAITPL